MFENIYEALISLAAGLLLGALISWFYLRQKIRERDEYIEDLETSVMEKVENLNARVREQETNLERLNSELSQREKVIANLNASVQEKDDMISGYEEKIADLEKQNRDGLARAEVADERLRELDSSLIEKEQEVAALIARVNAMQDDLSILDGIGPKISAVLGLAGIKSFSQLASTDEDRIRDILEAENPNLLRLTDPSTWFEQARMAADGNWEALSSRQDKLKSARRAEKIRKTEDIN
jgi:predicted flap endonuclease-1-like 5' DNA nuclease